MSPDCATEASALWKMRYLAVFLVGVSLFAFAAAADAADPTFERYLVTPTAVTKPANVRLNSAKAKRFRTALREGAKAGPNFAGQYTLVKWGCGTACIEVGIVDAMTGRVHFPRQLQPLAFQSVTDETPALQYRRDSRLLIVSGSPEDREASEGIYSYLWDGQQLKQLAYVRKEWRR